MPSSSSASPCGIPGAPRRTVRWRLAALACALASGAAASTAQAAPPPTGLGVPEYEIVLGVNAFRAQHRLAPLRPSWALTSAAHAHSADMAQRRYYGHDTLNGWAWNVRIKRYVRARLIGETLDLLYGGGDPANDPSVVVSDWIRSPRHRAVMLSPGLRRIGVARAVLDEGRPAFFTADYSS